MLGWGGGHSIFSVKLWDSLIFFDVPLSLVPTFWMAVTGMDMFENDDAGICPRFENVTSTRLVPISFFHR